MLRLILILTLFLPELALSADSLGHARLSLKKWGFAYCLHTYQKNDAAKLDAGAARGGYFELGGHNDDAAYENVRKFIDTAMKTDQRINHETGQPVVLIHCLDIYESPSYKKVISAQDRFLK